MRFRREAHLYKQPPAVSDGPEETSAHQTSAKVTRTTFKFV
jgi:hypothetical protein